MTKRCVCGAVMVQGRKGQPFCPIRHKRTGRAHYKGLVPKDYSNPQKPLLPPKIAEKADNDKSGRLWARLQRVFRFGKGGHPERESRR